MSNTFHSSSRLKSYASRNAFTLIEVLVSTAILGLLVLMLATITNRITSAWVQSTGQTERRQNARAIADFISNDLRGALLPISTDDASSLQFVRNPTDIGSDYRNADAIFWQAPIAVNTYRGDIAEVGYFVKWFEDSGNRHIARLCRFYVDATDKNNFLIYSNPTNWLKESILDAVAPAKESSVQSDNYRGLFAENVIGFWARCLDQDGDDLGNFDSRATGSLPSRVEISIALIDSRSAARISADLKSAIQNMVGQAKNVTEFLEKAQQSSSLVSIQPGLRGYTTIVYLQNSQ